MNHYTRLFWISVALTVLFMGLSLSFSFTSPFPGSALHPETGGYSETWRGFPLPMGFGIFLPVFCSKGCALNSGSIGDYLFWFMVSSSLVLSIDYAKGRSAKSASLLVALAVCFLAGTAYAYFDLSVSPLLIGNPNWLILPGTQGIHRCYLDQPLSYFSCSLLRSALNWEIPLVVAISGLLTGISPLLMDFTINRRPKPHAKVLSL